MLKYIFKRILQMIPTVLGVVLITFVLFNVAGGSPAEMTLGRHVSPKALEEFDEQRGFNKPLLFGYRTTTRAYPDTDFEQNPAHWRGIDSVVHHENGWIELPAGSECEIPLLFDLRADTAYEWELEYRLSAGDSADKKDALFGGNELSSSGSWERMTIEFEGADPDLRLIAGTRDLEIRSLKLRRLVANPFNSQLAHFLGQICRLDFGYSLSTKQRVSELLLAGVGPSLALTVPILISGVVVSVALSLVCAFFRNSWLDRFFVILAVALMSINYLVWIVAGQYLLGYRMGWFPVWGFESWRYLLLPVFIGVVSGLGMNLRFYRTIMLDEMYKEYVRTAAAKGASKTRILFWHVLKNALIPIVTNVVIALPFLYTGSLLLESFFGIPGLGYLAVNAINSSDVDVVRAIVLIGAFLFVFANLITDICYAALDPRVKLR